MLISTTLTTGQITFILRVVVQILSSGGLFFIGLIILGNAPRIASISTHDVINRVAGRQTVISTSFKWFFKRGKTNDPTSTSRLAVGIALLISYTLVTKLTDVGLIGLRACQTAGASYNDNPASIHTDEQALAMVTENMRTGSDPAMIEYFRCDSSQAYQLDDNSTLFGCTSWRNSTYADKKIFEGLNLSDTAVLMPRQLAKYTHDEFSDLALNAYFLGPLSRRIEEPTIMNGILVYPHETGFRAFLGAPNLPPFTRTILPQTLALEVEVGCMTVGIYDAREITSVSQSTNTFLDTRNDDTWRRYAGPDYLKDVISQTVDEIRNYSMPAWNMSDVYNGLAVSFNHSYNSLSTAANVRRVSLPDPPSANGSSFSDQYSIFRNCSDRLNKQLNLTGPPIMRVSAPACNMLGLGGSVINGGELFADSSYMVCAAAAQVNLARANISVDGNGKVDLSFVRLPSDLNVIVADYWGVVHSERGTGFDMRDSNYRYILTPNPDGQTTHHISTWVSRLGDFEWGAGTGANSFSSIAEVVVQSRQSNDKRVSTLSYLKENINVIKFQPSRVTQWAGEMGASYILGSTAFNGWAAASLQSGPLTVLNTGGKAATCYNSLYALAFVPLFLMATVVAFLSLEMLFSLTLLKARKMETSYGGLKPYTSLVCADKPSDTLLIWENYDQPRLEPVQNGRAVQVGGNGTAVEYLHTNSSWKE